MMRAARLVVDVDNRLVWSRCTQPSDQGWATPTPNPLIPVPNRSVYSGALMRDAPSVQSEFHRVGRSDPPASGSRVPDIKTQPSSLPGPWPATGPLPDQPQSQRVGRPRPPASGSGVPDIKTHPSPLSGPLPAAGPLSAQSVQDVCTDICVKVPYSVCSTVLGPVSYTHLTLPTNREV